MTKAEAMVSVAGPLMNFVIAIITTIILAVLLKYNLLSNLTAGLFWVILVFLMELVLINVGLGLFNLIPIPPLDGSKILIHLLPYNARRWFESKQQLFYIIFLVIWITGLTNYIISPCINGVTSGIFMFIGKIFNINLSVLL